MIENYATEGIDAGTPTEPGTFKPNGVFTVTKENTKKASYEVLATHLGMDKAAADAHLAKYFDTVWDHFDVNGKGSLDAVELNHLMRDLCKPVKEFITLE